MRKLIPILLLAAAACAPAGAGTTPAASVAPAAASPSLVGAYLLRQINGHDLPAASPMEPNVELSRGVMQLSPDGTFAITLTGRRNQEPTPGDENMHGTYTVTGDVLAFSGANAGDHSPTFHFTRAGAALTLRDEGGNTYVFNRQ